MPSADPDNARCERGAISRFVFHVGLEWHEKSSGPHAMVVSFRGIRVLCSARAGPPGPCSKDARKTDCFYKFYGCTSQKVRRRRRQIQVTRGSLVHLADRLGHQVTGSRTTHDTNQGFEITHVASVKLALQGTIARPPPPPPTHSLLLIDCGGGAGAGTLFCPLLFSSPPFSPLPYLALLATTTTHLPPHQPCRTYFIAS